MKGLIRCLANGALLLATAGVPLGCCTTGSSCNDCNSGCSACGDSCGACADSCNGCGSGGCGNPIATIKQNLHNFDYEQLHPDHCWPEQYGRESARRVNEPFRRQMVNGNIVEQTMWEHYFHPEKERATQLNDGGKERLKYLARRRPYVIPNLLLQTSFDPKLDEARREAILTYVKTVSMQPVEWEVTLINSAPWGMFGEEAPKAITKMIGPGGGPPAYEPQIKQSFLQANVGGP